MEEVRLSQPWVVWARKLAALFANDEEVNVRIDVNASAPSVTVHVDNAAKADALAELIPEEVEFGNVTMAVTVVPSNDARTDAQLWRQAFDGNPALSRMDVEELPDGTPVTFALFEPECAQYFADDLSNPRGLQTRTFEQVARDVLRVGDVMVTTEAIGG